ncbi:hypothetical protein Tco_0976729 [Tanacetum coccineum]|uniref:Reverse transcriptase domain-containing protein n=1 Tax=Tanacetum coccineum TaxID=301880 RepID=A0ABQ5EII0_9ASTR
MVTIHHLSQNTTQPKAKGFSKLKGGKDNSMALVQDGRDKIVISRLLLVNQARKCHVDVRKHMKMIGFTLESLTQQAQMSLSRIATLAIRLKLDLKQLICGGNFNQNRQGAVYQAPPYQPPTIQPPVYQAHPQQMQGVSKTDFENYVKANDAVLRNMQNQGQEFMCTLKSNLKLNPRKHVNAITTRSGKTCEGPSIPLVPTPVVSTPLKEPEQNPETLIDKVQKPSSENTAQVPPPEEEDSIFIEIPKPKAKKTVNIEIQEPNSPEPNSYQPKLPYPERMKVRENDKPSAQHSRFLKMFKQLRLEIGLKDGLIEMPKFNKWLSGLLRNKEKLEEITITTVNAECSTIIMNKVPEKLEDPRKFLIPCALQELDRTNALADSGARINLLPHSIYKQLGLEALTPTSRRTLERWPNVPFTHPMVFGRDVEIENSNEPVLLQTPLSDKGECFDPGDEIDVFLAMEISMDYEEGYYESEGDVLFLESFFCEDTSHNFASEVISDHDTSISFSPRSDPLHHEFVGELITLPSRIVSEHEDYLNRMTLLCDISTSRSQENVHANQSLIIDSLPVSPIPVEDSDPVHEEIDIFLIPDDLIPPGVENDDSEDEDNKFPNLDHQDNPLSPRPLSEPPDVEKCLEPEAGILINKVFKGATTPCAHDVACSFFAQPTTSPQLKNEDFQQIDEDDLEELDLRWQVAMFTIRVKKFIQKTGRNLEYGRNQGRKSYGDNGRSNAPTNKSSSQALVAQDGLGGYDWSNGFELEPVNYALMAISSSSSSSSSDNEVQKCSKQCLKSFKTLQKNYDSKREKHSRARLEIQGYELALESLESRILVHEKNELAWGEKYDQMSARDKTSLGYDTQLNEMSNNSETDSEISLSVFYVITSDKENTPANDRFSKADGFHNVPPPITGNFLTPRADISFVGLDEYAIRKKIIESKTTDLNTKTSETIDDEDDVSEVQTVSPVKPNETQTVKTRVHKIGQTSQKQGIRFNVVYHIS